VAVWLGGRGSSSAFQNPASDLHAVHHRHTQQARQEAIRSYLPVHSSCVCLRAWDDRQICAGPAPHRCSQPVLGHAVWLLGLEEVQQVAPLAVFHDYVEPVLAAVGTPHVRDVGNPAFER
jgi:hypothetical protein